MKNDLKNMPTRRSEYLTIPEAAEMLRVSQRSLYRWMREGQLRCFRVGNTTRIAVKDMDDFIERHTGSGAMDEQPEGDQSET